MMNTGKHTTGKRMMSAFIMGYGIGIANAAQFIENPMKSGVCLFIGLSMTLFAWLFDWNRKRETQ